MKLEDIRNRILNSRPDRGTISLNKALKAHILPWKDAKTFIKHLPEFGSFTRITIGPKGQKRVRINLDKLVEWYALVGRPIPPALLPTSAQSVSAASDVQLREENTHER